MRALNPVKTLQRITSVMKKKKTSSVIGSNCLEMPSESISPSADFSSQQHGSQCRGMENMTGQMDMVELWRLRIPPQNYSPPPYFHALNLSSPLTKQQ